LPIRDEYVVNGGFFSIEEGRRAMNKLLDLKDMPTAVFISGDHMAIGAMEAIKAKGLRIPEDISIIGYDDIDMAAYVSPKLTTVKQDTDRIGASAGQLLIEQMNEKKKMLTTDIIPVELIIRESCTSIN
jgi:DNA-binding LacI/PurR family transcriptional regulator